MIDAITVANGHLPGRNDGARLNPVVALSRKAVQLVRRRSNRDGWLYLLDLRRRNRQITWNDYAREVNGYAASMRT